MTHHSTQHKITHHQHHTTLHHSPTDPPPPLPLNTLEHHQASVSSGTSPPAVPKKVSGTPPLKKVTPAKKGKEPKSSISGGQGGKAKGSPLLPGSPAPLPPKTNDDDSHPPTFAPIVHPILAPATSTDPPPPPPPQCNPYAQVLYAINDVNPSTGASVMLPSARRELAADREEGMVPFSQVPYTNKHITTQLQWHECLLHQSYVLLYH